MEKRKSSEPSIRSRFNQHFRVIPADSHELRHIAHRIRYEVYCEELGYEDKACFPDKCEADEYDLSSQHCLLQVKSSGIYAGCIRLIPGARRGERHILPFERLYGDTSFSSDKIDLKNLKPSSYGEISRAAVLPYFRRKKYHNDLLAGNQLSVNIEEERKNYPLIGFGLYLVSAVMVIASGYERAFAMMEPRLARRLRMGGIRSTQVGPVVEHRGRRAPFQITTRELEEGVSPAVRELIADIRGVITSSKMSKEHILIEKTKVA